MRVFVMLSARATNDWINSFLRILFRITKEAEETTHAYLSLDGGYKNRYLQDPYGI